MTPAVQEVKYWKTVYHLLVAVVDEVEVRLQFLVVCHRGEGGGYCQRSSKCDRSAEPSQSAEGQDESHDW